MLRKIKTFYTIFQPMISCTTLLMTVLKVFPSFLLFCDRCGFIDMMSIPLPPRRANPTTWLRLQQTASTSVSRPWDSEEKVKRKSMDGGKMDQQDTTEETTSVITA